jgi:hypothetical protein
MAAALHLELSQELPMVTMIQNDDCVILKKKINELKNKQKQVKCQYKYGHIIFSVENNPG